MDKSLMKDSTGNLITQGLFLELGYKPTAMFTLKDDDYTYKGKLYPSLKKIYFSYKDPTEYMFATETFVNFEQWTRITNNKLLTETVDSWRYELELLLRCEGIYQAREAAKGGNFQASKWMADKGWEKRSAGRPSKAEVQKQVEFEAKANDVVSVDFKRLLGDT